MAEAPPPPPNLSYNEFRTWRKNNGIRSTTQELSASWQEYSASRKTSVKKSLTISPVKKSPSKSNVKSPVKSPKRYGGLTSANLLGLPPDVQRMVAARIGKESVRSMQTAAKGTGRFVQEQLKGMCGESLTQLEILNGLDKILLPISVGVRNAQPFNEEESNDVVGNNLLLLDRIKAGVVQDKLGVTSENIQDFKAYVQRMAESKYFLPLGSYGSVDVGPKTMFKLYMRRKSCLAGEDGDKYVETAMRLARSLLILMARQEYNDIAHHYYDWLPIQQMITGERDPQSWTRIILFDQATRYYRRAKRVAWIASDPELIRHANRLYHQIATKITQRKKVENLRELAILTVQSLRNAYELM